MCKHSILRRSSGRALSITAGVAILTVALGLSFSQPVSASARDKVKAKVNDSTLTIQGTSDSDTVIVRLRAGDPSTLEVATAAGGSAEFQFKASKITSVEVSAGAGNDVVTLDESNGALPPATIEGGAGNDTLSAGSGDDVIRGGAGDDRINGGPGDDNITAGAGNDIVNAGAGDDAIRWTPGDGTDTVEGGDGVDRVIVKGSDSAETFTTVPNGTRVRFDRISPEPFSLDIGSTEELTVRMHGGDDSFSAANGLATLIHLTLRGGDGNDTILGGDGNDDIRGGNGNDFIDGNRGTDTVQMGAGDDTFQWDPGDGSDIVDGNDGADRLIFNGANIGEEFDLAPNGTRLRFARNIAAIVMDIDTIETVTINTLGGADTVNVGDLSSTAVRHVDVALAGFDGVGDGSVDSVVVSGTNAADSIKVVANGQTASVDGIAARLTLTGAEVTDVLAVNALAGDDAVEAAGITANAIQYVADGGDGADVIVGGAGADTLRGGPGDDILIGGPGFDTLDGGPGNNVLIQD